MKRPACTSCVSSSVIGGIYTTQVSPATVTRAAVGGTIDGMTLLILFLAVLAILALAAILEKTPDTHREVSQHGNFEF